MSPIQGDPQEPMCAQPHHDGDIFRTLLVSSLMGCPSSLIDRNRVPVPRVMDRVCHRLGFWISIGDSRGIKGTSPSWFFLNILI